MVFSETTSTSPKCSLVTALQNGNEIFPAMGALLHEGAEIHVYQPTMLHTKLLVIDSEFVSVGSTNFDMRSIRLNDEASLNIYNSDFAAQMEAVFEKNLLEAEPYSLARWKSRPLKEKFSEKIMMPIKSQL